MTALYSIIDANRFLIEQIDYIFYFFVRHPVYWLDFGVYQMFVFSFGSIMALIQTFLFVGYKNLYSLSMNIAQ